MSWKCPKCETMSSEVNIFKFYLYESMTNALIPSFLRKGAKGGRQKKEERRKRGEEEKRQGEEARGRDGRRRGEGRG